MKNSSFLPLLSFTALVPLLRLVGTGSATNKKVERPHARILVPSSFLRR